MYWSLAHTEIPPQWGPDLMLQISHSELARARGNPRFTQVENRDKSLDTGVVGGICFL